MKNITLLFLGIFIGVVAVIYIFGALGGNGTPSNFKNSPVVGTATPGSIGIIPSGSPAISSKPSYAATPTPAPTNTSSVLTKSAVAQHSSQNDCYMIIDNKVYDVTQYIYSHPGGRGNIVSYCGQDATGIFSSIHSNYAWNLLSGYFIGNLAAG